MSVLYEVSGEAMARSRRGHQSPTVAGRPIHDPDYVCSSPLDRGAAVDESEAEYDRLGEQIDVLADRAKAARLRGETVKAERLGAEVRALVAGPYRLARKRYAALLDQARETKP